MESNIMRCETCGATSREKILFEKPKRIAYLSDITILSQKTGDTRTQENICMDCFRKEIEAIGRHHKNRFDIFQNGQKIGESK